MRDLDFVVGDQKLGSLLVYGYRNEPLRRVVLQHIRASVEELGKRLVLCDPDDFVQRVQGGGLFVAEDEVPYLDWGIFSDVRLGDPSTHSPHTLDLVSTDPGADGLSEDEDYRLYSLAGIIQIVRGRPPNSPLAVLFTERSLAQDLAQLNLPDEVRIDCVVETRKQDVPAVVRALSAGLDKDTYAEIQQFANDAWQAGMQYDDLCEEIEAATVRIRTAKGLNFSRDAGSTSPPRRLQRLIARDVIFGTQSRRQQLIAALLAGDPTGPEVLHELVLATMRVAPFARGGQTPVARANAADLDAWSVWLRTLVEHAVPITSSGRAMESMWPRPDRRSTALLRFLEDFRAACGRAENATADCGLVERGARWIESNFPKLSTRIKGAISDVEAFVRQNGHVPDTPSLAVVLEMKGWLTEEECSSGPPQEKSPEESFGSLIELAGNQTVTSFFLRYFDHRLADPRAYPKPLLIIGEDVSMNWTTADLLGRLYVCQIATSVSPIVCGKCEGCQSANFRVAIVDASSIRDLAGSKDFVKQRAQNRGTVGGTPVTVLHNVERLRSDSCLEILKTYESSVGAGLTIFTSRDRFGVDEALRSRCTVLHLWPVR